MDEQSLSQPFSEGQGRILVPDYDSQSSLDLSQNPKKQRNNSGSSQKSKKPSKPNKQSQATKMQTTQQPVVTSQSSSAAASTSTYTTARWSMSGWNHKSQGCQVAPTGSLLEEVLNEKKMALLKSPEVVEFLQGLQKDVQTLKEEELKNLGDGSHFSILDSNFPSKQTTKKSQKRKKSSSTRGQQDRTPVPSGGNSRQQSPGYDLDGQDPELLLFGRDQNAANSEERRAPNQGASQSDIWSKEASAFSTVTSTFPTNSLS